MTAESEYPSTFDQAVGIVMHYHGADAAQASKMLLAKAVQTRSEIGDLVARIFDNPAYARDLWDSPVAG